LKIETLTRRIVSYLRSTLVHPDPTYTKEWIYVGYPRPDVQMPRISVVQVANIQLPVGIGQNITSNTLGFYFDTAFDIDIWFKKGNRYVINGNTLGATALRDYYADKIIEAFIENRDLLLNSLNVQDIILTGVSTAPYMDEFELFRKTISLSFLHIYKFT